MHGGIKKILRIWIKDLSIVLLQVMAVRLMGQLGIFFKGVSRN